jgi:DprA winged helix domain
MSDEASAVSSELFYVLYSKRSRQTPLGKHPRAEEDDLRASDNAVSTDGSDAIELGKVDLLKAPQQPFGRGDVAIEQVADQAADEPKIEEEGEQKVYALLSDEPMHFDVLCSEAGVEAGGLCAVLTGLELNGLIERQFGDYYVRKVKKPPSRTVEVAAEAAAKVSRIINFIDTNWKGISRKYLQNYVAVFAFLRDMAGSQVKTLLDACLRFGPVRNEQIIEYVTPAMVRIGEM